MATNPTNTRQAEKPPFEFDEAAHAPSDRKFRYGIRTPEQLKQRCAEVGACEYMIEGLVPTQALGLVIGDSGLGKSPLLYQAAICVAAGIPFLGHEVRRGRVLYIDCENGIGQVDVIASRISAHLGLAAPPADLLTWNLNDSENGCGLEMLVAEAEPQWVIVDPLKVLYPYIERDSPHTIEAYQELRGIMQKYRCSTTGVHHLRKPGEQQLFLDGPSLHPWFLQARGPRELINGCDVRIGVDRPSVSSGEDLVIRGFRRVEGEIPLERVARVLDGDGEPLGFRALSGVDLLPEEQKVAFNSLALRFRFKDAQAEYRKGAQPTTDFLNKCIGAKILRKVAGRYEKTQAGTPDVVQPAAAA